MKLKDLLGISLVSIFLFPIILLGIMLAAGVVHIEFGNGKDRERLKETLAAQDESKQEEMETKQLKAYKALELKEKALQAREAEMNRDIEHLENLKLETVKAKDEILESRRKIEELVGKSAEIQDKQIASLAEVYGGMRPEEAAPILLSLDDRMVVKIMRKIPETRSTSKLLAALAALDVKRAARITEYLGGQAGNGKAKPRGETKPAGDSAPPQDKPETAPSKQPAPDAKKTEPQKKA